MTSASDRPAGGGGGDGGRADRLAASLRANLVRRKRQARALRPAQEPLASGEDDGAALSKPAASS